jgi:hypothetical protein
MERTALDVNCQRLSTLFLTFLRNVIPPQIQFGTLIEQFRYELGKFGRVKIAQTVETTRILASGFETASMPNLRTPRLLFNCLQDMGSNLLQHLVARFLQERVLRSNHTDVLAVELIPVSGPPLLSEAYLQRSTGKTIEFN